MACVQPPPPFKKQKKRKQGILGGGGGGAGGCTKANMSVALRGNFHVKGYMSKEAR